VEPIDGVSAGPTLWARLVGNAVIGGICLQYQWHTAEDFSAIIRFLRGA